MPNPYFQFKQFTVHQERAAMKVCTDSCLFGAWVANKLRKEKWAIASILDIGAGTGLLGLMLAQKSSAPIDAVELDEAAAQEATDNFNKSLWADRLQVITTDIRQLHLNKKYDLIISNPPFFEDDLKSHNPQRNTALHSEALSFEELLQAVAALINTNGFFAVLLPYHRSQAFISSARGSRLFPVAKTLVRQTERHPYFRSMLVFGTTSCKPEEMEIIIKKKGLYTAEFVELLRDYYLYLQASE